MNVHNGFTAKRNERYSVLGSGFGMYCRRDALFVSMHLKIGQVQKAGLLREAEANHTCEL